MPSGCFPSCFMHVSCFSLLPPWLPRTASRDVHGDPEEAFAKVGIMAAGKQHWFISFKKSKTPVSMPRTEPRVCGSSAVLLVQSGTAPCLWQGHCHHASSRDQLIVLKTQQAPPHTCTTGLCMSL